MLPLYYEKVHSSRKWTLSAMTSKNKNGGDSWGLCMEGLWRGWRFAMIGMKKLQDISDVACILSSNGNARVLLTFKKIRLVLLFQTP